MIHHPLRALFALTLLAASFQAQAPDVSEAFVLPEGYRMELWATSDQLFNPTAMDVDPKGRVWISEGVNYRRFGPGRNPGRDHAAGDRIVILEDTDGDGRCDSSKVFVQDEDLVSPLGIAVFGRHVLVSCSPHAILYSDDDGDDRPDRKRIFLTGFGGHDHDHGLHSFMAGPDGCWYFCTGNAGPHVVKDADGFTLRAGSVYRGGGKTLAPNQPGLRSSDGSLVTGGLMLRVDPGPDDDPVPHALTVLAHNFRNPYELAVDSFGELWTSDNDDDGTGGCRTTWVMPGGNYGFFSADGSRTWQADRRPGQSSLAAAWHSDDPGVMPAGTINGAGSPTGVAICEHGMLPSRYEGAVLNADAGANAIYAHLPQKDGAGIELQKTVLLQARLDEKRFPKGRWFRPSDVSLGTDGSLFIADWYDPGVGGHGAGDRKSAGHVYRLVKADAPRRSPRITINSLPDAFDALRNPAPSVRWLARKRILRKSEDALPILRDRLAKADSILRARLLWIASAMGTEGRALVRAATSDPAPKLRMLALRIWNRCASAEERLAVARERVGDPHPRVRRELALGLSTLPDAPLELLVALCQKANPDDRHEIEALGLAVGERGADVLKALISKPEGAWTRRDATLAWRLHPASWVPHFRRRAFDAGLSEADRLQAQESLAFIPTQAAANAMVDLALAGTPTERALAESWVRKQNESLWETWRPARRLPASGLNEATLVWKSEVMSDGAVDVDLDVSGAEELWLVATDGKRGMSYDWIAWVAPRLISDDGSTLLTDLPWSVAKTGWGGLHKHRNTLGGPIMVEGKRVPVGIGAHAPSRISWRLDPAKKWRRLKLRAALDDMGSRREGSTADVQFQVHLRRKEDLSWVKDAVAVVRRESVDTKSQEALERLALHPRAALHLLELERKKALPASLRTAAARQLRKNPDLSVRTAASQLFPRLSSDGQALPPLDALCALEGNPIRGREVFFSVSASCSRCHTHGTRGGDVGPELSQIRTKYGRRELFDAILNPSASIAFGYDSWLIGTDDGELYSGFVLSEGETLVLKDSNGKRHAIPTSSIDFRRKESSSTMPDNVALGLSPQALADLVSFLSDDPTKPLRALPSRDLLAEGLEGFEACLPGGAARDAVWSLEDGILHCKGNPAGYLRTKERFTNFRLRLEWRFPEAKRPGNSGVLLRVQAPDKVWPKSVEAQLMHRNAGDIWNIDAFPLVVDPHRTSGRRTQKALPCNEKPLGEWNLYEIELTRGKLTLLVNGEIQNQARDVDEIPGFIALQSEGAPIEFRNLILTPLQR